MVEQRNLSLPLMVALLLLPAVFGWLLLRRGYTRSLRRTVLVYALVPWFFSALAAVLGAANV